MTVRTLLWVGCGYESAMGSVGGNGGFDTRIAVDAETADSALADLAPTVAVVRGRDETETLALIEALARTARRQPVPILAILPADGEVEARAFTQRGASDCMRDSEGNDVLLARLELLCRLADLAATVLNQRAMIEKHVQHILDAREQLQSVRSEMEALVEHGPVVTYSSEAPPDPGSFRDAEEIEHACPTYLDATIFPLSGFTPDDLVGDLSAWKSLVHPEDLEHLKERARRLHDSGRCSSRYRIRHANGRIRWISDECRAVRRSDDAIVAVLGTPRDVTRETLASEAVRDSAEILERARRLQGAQRLAGTIAHDFNNMLGIVMCHAQYAARQLPNDHPAQHSLDQMLAAVVRAQAGTKLLLQLSQRKPQYGAEVHVNAVIRDTVKLLDPLLGSAIRVSTSLDPGSHCVAVERSDFENALVNLCVNARDAMPMGGTLEIRSRCGSTGPTSGAGSSVVIEVADTGVGMEAHVAEQCLEPFFTTKATGEGSGLGLFSVAQTVRQSGGSIAVESKQGKGTTIRLELPTIGPSAAARESRRASVVATLPTPLPPSAVTTSQPQRLESYPPAPGLEG